MEPLMDTTMEKMYEIEGKIIFQCFVFSNAVNWENFGVTRMMFVFPRNNSASTWKTLQLRIISWGTQRFFTFLGRTQSISEVTQRFYKQTNKFLHANVKFLGETQKFWAILLLHRFVKFLRRNRDCMNFRANAKFLRWMKNLCDYSQFPGEHKTLERTQKHWNLFFLPFSNTYFLLLFYLDFNTPWYFFYIKIFCILEWQQKY